HPLETTIMFFRALWEGGYKSYAHLADIISDKVLSGYISPEGVSEEFRKRVFNEYHRTADIKKIDVGRGLIHGFAEDFINDPSSRLILSHTEGSLSSAEKEIGASVSFGQVDILIPDRGDRLRELSSELLERTFPGLPRDDFNLLINGEIQTIVPGTPLLKKNSIPESLTLIITGTVDAVDNGKSPSIRFTAGSLIGEDEFLTRKSADMAYRSRNHVKVLRIPADIYVHALSKANMLEQRLKVLENRRHLLSGKFPGNVVSCPRLDDLSAVLKEKTWRKGRKISSGKDELYILSEGSLTELRAKGQKSSRVLGSGDWFNLQSIFSTSSDVSWQARERCRVWILPGDMIREIPILGWTLTALTPE
ncbi:MAG: hypothetical protein KAH21_00955, partial [Spirochaetaceae bacterium]|nr:hypothetical protein [Spirochaetaceae bacterium]